MEDWIKVTLILCAFGTLREFRPSEPFVTEFLGGPWRNVTNDQLNREVYPVGTYSYLAQLVFVFLITDFLRFKPVIILSGLSGIAVYAIMLWTKSIEWLQVSQFFYGTYMSTEVAYYTYIYAKVDSSKYLRVSSYTRIAALVGRFLAGVSCQLLVLFKIMDYRQLNYITFISQILATFWALWLPPVQYGIYFHRKSTVLNSVQVDITAPPHKQLQIKPDNADKRKFRSNVVEAATLITRHARAAYSRPKVIAWSALYAGALALFVQVQIYVQVLWSNIRVVDNDTVLYNGAVEAVQTLLGATGAFVASLLSRSVVPCITAAAQGIALFFATATNSVFVSYAGYIVVGLLYHYTITLASAKISSQLIDESCFGLIFGINTFIGTGFQSLITLIITQILALSIVDQFFAISGLFLVLAVSWFIGWIINYVMQKKTINLNSRL